MHIKVDISCTPTEVEVLSRFSPSPWRFGVAAGSKIESSTSYLIDDPTLTLHSATGSQSWVPSIHYCFDMQLFACVPPHVGHVRPATHGTD